MSAEECKEKSPWTFWHKVVVQESVVSFPVPIVGNDLSQGMWTSQTSSYNVFSILWMEIAEPFTAGFERNQIFLFKQFLKFLQAVGGSGSFFNSAGEKIFLRLEFCFPWCNSVRKHLLV